MNSTPLVSICIPAFNASAYINESINSIISQSYQNLEIIIVNDGSTDNTLSLLEEYNDSRIRIINQTNKGQCNAANQAFKASKGEYIKFFDADDILSENFIESQMVRLNGRKDAIASSSWGRFQNNDINSFKLNPETVWRDMIPIDWLIESLNGACMMQCAIWLIPRPIIEKAGLWNEKLSLINDFDFFIRILLNSEKIMFTQDAILYYRSGLNNSLSSTKSSKAYQSAYLSIELGVKNILKYENSKRTNLACANTFKLWAYEFYPNEMNLYNSSCDWVNKLGGSDLKFPAGGKTKLMTNLLGWKLTKKLKLACVNLLQNSIY